MTGGKTKNKKKANLLGLSKKPLQVQMQYPQPCALFCIILGCSNSILCYKKEREREREGKVKVAVGREPLSISMVLSLSDCCYCCSSSCIVIPNVCCVRAPWHFLMNSFVHIVFYFFFLVV